ncbi:MAG: hypothetical protein KF678_14695 [Phycisphaeraceae bacterium]|nr:hypothetical protein [Phycisphaeraceae bacterium]
MPSAPSATASLVEDDVPPDAAEPAPSADALRELTEKFGGNDVSGRISSPRPVSSREDSAVARRTSISLLARRADLCARACDWAIRRHDNQVGGGGFDRVKPEYNMIRDEAATMQPLYVWMIHQETARIARDDWVMLAGCYHNMACAAQLVASFNDGTEAPLDLVELLAEAQSMVRSALGMVEVERDDVQQSLYEWCRDEGRRRRWYLANLSSNEAANPALWGGLKARIAAAADRCEAARSRDKSQQKLLNTIRYHKDQILVDEAADHKRDWTRIESAIQQFLETEGKPSDPRLVDLIVPIADLVPDDLALSAVTFRRILPFVDQRIARENKASQATTGDRAPSPELAEAREMLRGKVAVLIGGEA